MVRQLSSFCTYLILSVILLQACEQKSSYQQFVDRHYRPEAQNDSLFLGYRFGMTRQEFFDHSWELNRQKVVREGNTNESVRYEVTDLKSRAKMNFYPLFYQDSVYSMPIKYSYTGWAPWNKDLWADSLEQDVLELYKQKYGYEFEHLEHPQRKDKAYFTLEGNKLISIYAMDDNQHVAVMYTDLKAANRMKKEDDEN